MEYYIAVLDIKHNEQESELCGYKISRLNSFDVHTGTNMDDFMNYINNLCNTKTSRAIYVYNLDFVGLSIYDYLLRNNFKYVSDVHDFEDKSFLTMISGECHCIYDIDICFVKKSNNNAIVRLYDASKMIPLTISEMIDKFKLKSDTEDIEALRVGMESLNHYGLLKVRPRAKRPCTTIAMSAFEHFKSFFGKSFDMYFATPNDDVCYELRQCYFGGFVYLNPEYNYHITQRVTEKGYVIDNNGLYGYIMKTMPLPYGQPKKFEGNYNDLPKEVREQYPLYIQKIQTKTYCALKENKLPAIPIATNFKKTEYLCENSIIKIDQKKYDKGYTDGLSVHMTNVDFKLFKKHYVTAGLDLGDDSDYAMTYVGGYMFKNLQNLNCKHNLPQWVDYWCNERVQAEQDGNMGLRYICKLIINSLSGKFGSGANDYRFCRPTIDEHTDSISFVYEERAERDIYGNYTEMDEETGEIPTHKSKKSKSLYIPLSIFITSYGRSITINMAQTIQDKTIALYGKSKYIYSDTDSVHFELSDIPDYIDIDDTEIGKWKIEYEFEKGKYFTPKMYVLKNAEDKLKITLAGIPKESWNNVTFENFEHGHTYETMITSTVHGGATKIKHNIQLPENMYTYIKAKIK